jgi:hypothetical protein
MIFSRRTLGCAGLCCLATLAFCNRDSRTAEKRKVSQSIIIDIVPGKSIGEARLGMKVELLPSRAVIHRPAATLDDIQLLINDSGEVEDIWIDDVHTFPHDLRCQGKAIPKDATVESIQTIVGKCEPLAGRKGGFFYNCAAGLAVATDFAKKTLQLRVKPIADR